MKRFIQGEHRGQETFLPASLDDYVTDANPVRVVDVFVDELDLVKLDFEGAIPADTGRPAYYSANNRQRCAPTVHKRVFTRSGPEAAVAGWRNGYFIQPHFPLPASQKPSLCSHGGNSRCVYDL